MKFDYFVKVLIDGARPPKNVKHNVNCMAFYCDAATVEEARAKGAAHASEMIGDRPLMYRGAKVGRIYVKAWEPSDRADTSLEKFNL